MRIGIVGSEAAKFTPETQEQAREMIRHVLKQHFIELEQVVSGACHLGGIDIWAIEEAKALGIDTHEYPPEVLQWDPPGRIGFKRRNLQIVEASDLVVCITLKELPPTFTGKWVFPQGCYHCKTPPEHHVKSGGCWTMREAQRMGKDTWLVVVDSATANVTVRVTGSYQQSF